MSTMIQLVQSMRSRILDAIWLLILISLTGAICLVFSIPWITLPSLGDGNLEHYAPMTDGDAWLSASYSPEGDILSFISVNIEEIPPSELVALSIEKDAHPILNTFVQGDDEKELNDNELIRELARSRVFVVGSQDLGNNSSVLSTSKLIIRSGEGDFLFGESEYGDADFYFYDPPRLLRPSRLEPGTKWEGNGSTTNDVDYRFQGEVIAAESYGNMNGQVYPDCLKLAYTLALGMENSPEVLLVQHQWICGGMGVAAMEILDGNGDAPGYIQVTLTGTYATPEMPDDGLAIAKSLPALKLEASPSPHELTSEDISQWMLTEISSPLAGDEELAYESTIRPVWIPTDPPALLTATLNGDLVARSTEPPAYEVLWRFHSGGTIFGQPGIDPVSGHIFFGTSSGRLVALDANGLFLWSFDAGDNIASQPLIIDEKVIFGSEDRHIYALDKSTAALMWKFRTGGAVASSPVAVAGLVIIGSDDGNVYALDAETGEQVWFFHTEGAVEAPIVSADGVIYAASRDSNLYVINASNGALAWKTEASEALRSAPALGNDGIYFTDEYGALYAFGLTSGKYLWSDNQNEYHGPLLVMNDTLLVAGEYSLIYLLSTDGVERQPPAAAYTKAGEQSTAGFYLGISEGGGAAWLADFNGQVWRFGP